MEDQNIRPLDLSEKRKAYNLTQQILADKLGISRVHLARIESGMRDISFPIALDCVALFGSLKIGYKGNLYTIKLGEDFNNPHKHHKPDLSAPSTDLELSDEISRLGKEARELLMQAKDIGRYVLAIKHNPKVAKPYLVRTAKEAIDLAAWVESFKDSLRTEMPEVYREAEALVRKEFEAEMTGPEEASA